MELRVNIDRSKALQALREFPQAMGDALRPAVKAGLRDIQVQAAQDHRFTSRSGNLDRSITPDYGPGALQGRVQLDTGIASYGPIQHGGSGVYGPKGQPFTVEAKKGKALRWVMGGRFIFARRVTIQGVKGDPFLYRAADVAQPGIMARINRAIQSVIQGGR